MTWPFFAVLASILWSLINHIDKHLISKYFKGDGSGALVIFLSLAGFFVFPFVLFFRPSVLSLSFTQAAVIIASSIILIVATLIYFYALRQDETSIVVPLFQTVPVFASVLGYMFLHETLASYQVIGAILVLAAGFGLSLDIESDAMPKLKKAVFFWMLLASFLIALSGLIFKVMAIETDFWTMAFWEYIGNALMGVFFLVCIKSYRTEFLAAIRDNTRSILSLSALNEILNVVANLLFRFATLIAPIALVWTMAYGFQPFFVFIFGILITMFFPKFGTESLLRKNILQKIVAIAVMLLGTYIMNM